MAGHAQLKFVMTECPKTQIRLTGLKQKHATSLVDLHVDRMDLKAVVNLRVAGRHQRK